MRVKTKTSARRGAGYTLIEVMITLSIIGILAALGIPKFAETLNKSREASTKGSLGALRGALQVYYGNTEGWYPTDNLANLAPEFINEIPLAYTPPHHEPSRLVSVIASTAAYTDEGGWAYNNVEGGANWGSVHVGCTHKDSRDNHWTGY